ncbi:uncharacterized protein B0I36DRAFT_332445 [Microdochium trichocladiopsis]|uniref:NAD(P)-binding protein n=1 Tax=Microdochium trichocladiopsis TaxID=1682393 RepID=A0A9P9BLM5_9PEZI|nr:uncharacterized protein B0I36DRAFT_332445 [Microdochium trichocladiopsis]KAH7025044.1 hypothetical protein B0I36DRAFT_332445 [Microdochium trichocladiopsis]
MIAQGLEANGATVYILGRRLETLQNAAKTAKHGKLIPIQADVTSKESLLQAAEQIKSEQGFVNLVVANSGITGPGAAGYPADPTITQLRDLMLSWDTAAMVQTYEVNVVGVITTIAAFLELLDAGNRKGNVVQKSQAVAVSSIGGFSRRALGGYTYGSSKAAVMQLMKTLSTAWTPFDIRANVIAPGIYPSEMTGTIVKTQEENGWPRSVVPLQRAGDQQDLAGAILFLASRAGAYLNGNVLVTDGGRLGVLPSSY